MLSFFRKNSATQSTGQNAQLQAISHHLNSIEEEMKRIGYWSESALDLQSKLANGEIRSFADAPTFELWLQQVFLPNARTSVIAANLPKQSQVGLMALREYDYHSHIPEAQTLLLLLSEFDRLVEAYGRMDHDE